METTIVYYSIFWRCYNGGLGGVYRGCIGQSERKVKLIFRV